MSDKTKVFFDSNILVYFADGADPQKQLIAENLQFRYPLFVIVQFFPDILVTGRQQQDPGR